MTGGAIFGNLKRYLIIGCGWLGKPLAQRLRVKGAEVWATTSSKVKMEHLESQGIKAVFIDFTHDISQCDEILHPHFDSVIITIPPGSREVQQSLKLHERIADVAARIQTEHWVYCSSTSIYDKDYGNLAERDANVHSLIGRLEDLYLKTFSNPAILRFGGLIGKDRNPVIYLANKEKFEKPMAFVNLTSQADALDGLELAIEMRLDKIYNVVNPDHPLRYEFYADQAARRKLALPLPDTSDTNQGKSVSSDLFIQTTGYQFIPLHKQSFE